MMASRITPRLQLVLDVATDLLLIFQFYTERSSHPIIAFAFYFSVVVFIASWLVAWLVTRRIIWTMATDGKLPGWMASRCALMVGLPGCLLMDFLLGTYLALTDIEAAADAGNPLYDLLSACE